MNFDLSEDFGTGEPKTIQLKASLHFLKPWKYRVVMEANFTGDDFVQMHREIPLVDYTELPALFELLHCHGFTISGCDLQSQNAINAFRKEAQ